MHHQGRGSRHHASLSLTSAHDNGFLQTIQTVRERRLLGPGTYIRQRGPECVHEVQRGQAGNIDKGDEVKV